MADNEFCVIHTKRFTIEGRSRAGHETYFRVRDLNLALDIGRGPDFVVGVPNVLITHAHLDHAAGIPFYAAQRRLLGLGRGRVIVPEAAADGFRRLMALHEELTGTAYGIEVAGLAHGEAMRLDRIHEVRAHRATHRVPANAYEIIEVRHHLKSEFAGRDDIAQLRRDGVQIDEEYRCSLLFYTGDTDRGILEQNQEIFRSEVLMIECSFVEEGDEERAARYRHIHFDDIADFAERFENEAIILTHFSRRYTWDEIRATIRRRCPAVLRERLRLAIPGAGI